MERERQEIFSECRCLGEWLRRYEYNQKKLLESIHFSGLYLAFDAAVTFISFNNAAVKQKYFDQGQLFSFPLPPRLLLLLSAPRLLARNIISPIEWAWTLSCVFPRGKKSVQRGEASKCPNCNMQWLGSCFAYVTYKFKSINISTEAPAEVLARSKAFG